MTGPVPPSPPPADATGATSPPVRPARPPTPRRHVGRVAIVVAVAAATLATTACGGSTSDATPAATLDRTPTITTSPNPAPTESPTTTEPLSPEQEVEEAYLEAQAAFYMASAAADSKDPKLRETSTGPSLTKAIELLEGLRSEGLQIAFVDGEAPVPSVISVAVQDTDTATVKVCIVDDAQQVRASDGQVVDDAVATRLNEAEMKLVDGRWLLYEQTALKRWRDGDGCDR